MVEHVLEDARYIALLLPRAVVEVVGRVQKAGLAGRALVQALVRQLAVDMGTGVGNAKLSACV